MGTRSLTHIKIAGADSKTLLTFYRQCDGYPEGIGQDIVSFLTSKKMVNGFQNPLTEFNGIGCAAAQLISHLKGERAGNVYIYEADDKNCGEDFTYTVYRDEKDNFYLRCEDGEIGSTVLFDGAMKDFKGWLEKANAVTE